MAHPTPVLYEATVTVAFVNPVKGDAKTGSIKGEDGTYYRVKPELLDVFQVGRVYEIQYEPREFPPGNFQKYLATARDANGVAVTPERRPIPAPVSTQKAHARQQATGANLELSEIGLLKSYIEAGLIPLDRRKIVEAKKIIHEALVDEFGDEIPY